jgi:queuine/archaeosine tRNA-ribosyltransferase
MSIISEHKKFVSQIPEDLKEGDEIEVSDFGIRWKTRAFVQYVASGVQVKNEKKIWRYARRQVHLINDKYEQDPDCICERCGCYCCDRHPGREFTDRFFENEKKEQK